ncbi:MAG: hypothetical protein H7838_08490 [Magnetococcus sp. DMHC-8]
MAKSLSRTGAELLDQVAKARLILDCFNEDALNERGELADPAVVRSRLNAAKAHLLRAMEKAQLLR